MAAIGKAGDAGAQGFNKAEMKKNDKIAAAIVLRGMAKDGKFAADAAQGKVVKSAADAAQGKVVKSAAEGAEAIRNVKLMLMLMLVLWERRLMLEEQLKVR